MDRSGGLIDRSRTSVYLDWNATTPPHPDVVAAMVDALSSAWGNPASIHSAGRRARMHVEGARDAVAALTGFSSRDVTFTSGGTEANNLALRQPFAEPGGALVLSRIEHPSVVRAAEALADRGVVVEWAVPEPSGVVTAAAFADAINRASRRATVRLVALQVVNHETGVIQPIAELAELAHARGALLHVDAIQGVGRVHADAWNGADLLSLAAHKIRGPKGIGALVTRAGLRLQPLLFGGSQERGLRPGTQDAVVCAGLAVAAARASAGPARYACITELRDRFEAALLALGAEHGITPLRNGDAPRVPHVSNLSWPGWRGAELAAALDLEGVAVSSGAACSAGTAEPSAVLRAMLGEARAASAVRVSMGEDTTAAGLDEARRVWERVLARGGGQS